MLHHPVLPVGVYSVLKLKSPREGSNGTNSLGSTDRYPDQDNVHYEGFNYADDQGEVKLFRPNSDMSFIDFRRTMVDEWNSREGSKLL